MGGLERLGALVARYGIGALNWVLMVDRAGLPPLSGVPRLPKSLCGYGIRTGRRGRPRENVLLMDLVIIRWKRLHEMFPHKKGLPNILLAQALKEIRAILPEGTTLPWDTKHIWNRAAQRDELALYLGFSMGRRAQRTIRKRGVRI